jgi:small subunit ribosomal protein S2
MNDLYNREKTIVEMFKAGVQFGHKHRFWCPYMKHYIYTTKNKMDIIDINKTYDLFVYALDFIKETVKNGGQILLISTKKKIRSLLEPYAKKSNMPYVNNRWLGGTLTNYMSIKGSVNLLHKMQQEYTTGLFEKLGKKEQSKKLHKLHRLDKLVGGLSNLKGNCPSALFVIDARYENIAIKEAKCIGIPVIAIVDTNTMPTGIEYLIPGNDDSLKAVHFYLEHVTNAIISANIKDKLPNIE